MSSWEDELEATIVQLLDVSDALAAKAVEAGSALSAQSAGALLAAAGQAVEAATLAAEAVPALVDLGSLGLGDEDADAPALRSLAAGDVLPRLELDRQRLQRRSALMRAQLSVASTGRDLLAHADDDD
jgi:hypothetical protein